MCAHVASFLCVYMLINVVFRTPVIKEMFVHHVVSDKEPHESKQRPAGCFVSLLKHVARVFRLYRECLRSAESQEEELRGVTGGRTDPALLREADQRPGEAHQQPSTWTGELLRACST